MQKGHKKPGQSLVLLSHDARLAQTRQWILEQAGFQIQTVYTLTELCSTANLSIVVMFLLCNSLPAELRVEASQYIREHWKDAKLLIFVPLYPFPELPADELFPAMEGPERLVQTVRQLLAVS